MQELNKFSIDMNQHNITSQINCNIYLEIFYWNIWICEKHYAETSINVLEWQDNANKLLIWTDSHR